MKNTLKMTLAGLSALAMLTGCAFTRTTAAEAQTTESTLASPVLVTAGSELTNALDIEVSKRDASGEYDASEAVTLSPGEDLTITEAGTYILSGTYTDQMLVVSAGDGDKVQIVLDGASMTNSEGPVIYVQNADKVFITAADGTENFLSDGADYTLTDEV